MLLGMKVPLKEEAFCEELEEDSKINKCITLCFILSKYIKMMIINERHHTLITEMMLRQTPCHWQESLEASVASWPTSGTCTEPYMHKYTWKIHPAPGPHTLTPTWSQDHYQQRAELCVSGISLGWTLSKSRYVALPAFLGGTPESFSWISHGPAEVPCHSSQHDQYLSYGCVGRTGSYPLLPAEQTSLPWKPGYTLQNYPYAFSQPSKWFHGLAVQPGSVKRQHRDILSSILSQATSP